MVKFSTAVYSLGLLYSSVESAANRDPIARFKTAADGRFVEDSDQFNPKNRAIQAALSTDGNKRYFLENPNFSYWMDTKDDILSEFKNYMQLAEKRLGASLASSDQDKSLKTLQRFAELVDMIMYLQKVPFFGQYWYYGCWCAPEGFFNTAKQGYGEPVDAIDRSCRSMSYCYECAQLDHGQECSTEEVSYRWHGYLNEEGIKKIKCDDEPGTCGHALCSCDKNLAEELAINEDKWNLHHHHKWGEFNRDACLIKDEKKQVTNLSTNGANLVPNSSGGNVVEMENVPVIGGRSFGQNMEELKPSISLKFASAFGLTEEKYCCGEYGNRDNPRKPIKKYNNKGGLNDQQCCYDYSNDGFKTLLRSTPYDSSSHVCEDGQVKKTGQ